MPGPDVLFVLLESIARGTRRGVIASCGFSSGVVVHTMFCAVGVSVLIASSELAFSILKYFGAGYLLFLAYKSFTSKVEVPSLKNDDEKAKNSSNLKLFFTTFTMNVLNPKVLIFFVGFLPQFVEKDAKFAPILQIFVLGAIFMISALLAFSFVAFLSGRVRGVFCKVGFWKVEKWFRVIFFLSLGAMFLTF